MSNEADEDETPNDDDSCPICDKVDYCEVHHLATFATTEGEISGGELFDHQATIESLLVEAIVLTTVDRLPYPFCDAIEEMIDSGDFEDCEARDALNSNYSQVINALRIYFSEHQDVVCPCADETDEASGSWGYESQWAKNPKLLIEELLDKLRAAVAE